jgi:hypothetical protein
MEINGQMTNGQMTNGQMTNGQMTWNPDKRSYQPDPATNSINSVISGLIYDYKNCMWISAEKSFVPKFVGSNIETHKKVKEE